MEQLLQVRLEHLKTIPLDQIQDTIFALYRCEQCGEEIVESTMLVGNVQGIMNDFSVLTKTLLEEPSKLLKGLDSKKCKECGGGLKLQRLVYCRTNSQKGFDTHFRVNHQATSEESPVELVILTKRGEYSFVDTETRKSLLGI